MPTSEWYKKNKEWSAEYQRKWRKDNPEKIRFLEKRRRSKPGFNQKANVYKVKHTMKIRFGGQREFVLDRDNYQCVKCNMTMEQHKAKFNRAITIDHIDRNRSNNLPLNLQTLCLSCHSKKDSYFKQIGKGWKLTWEQVNKIRNEYKLGGISQRKLAKKHGLSDSTVFMILKNQSWKVENSMSS